MRIASPVILALSIALFCAICQSAQARGGFNGPISGAQATTVEKAKTLNDKSPVVLSGNIVSQLAGTKDIFIFRDATGEVQLLVPEEVFGNLAITPQTPVEVSGTVNIELGAPMQVNAVLLNQRQ